MDIIRKRLSSSELDPPGIRYNPVDDEIEQLRDGVWVADPSLDPRTNPTNLLPPRTGSTRRCDAAANMVAKIESIITFAVSSADMALIASNLLALIALFFPPIALIAAVLWVLLDLIISIGSVAVDGAFTSGVYDDLLCILYCQLDPDGQLSEAALNRAMEEIDATQSDIVYQICYQIMVGTLGWVGLSNAGATGEETGDCDPCNPCGALCVGFNPGDPLASGTVPGYPAIPPGSLDNAVGNPAPSWQDAYTYIAPNYQRWACVWIDLGAEYQVNTVNFYYKYNTSFGSNVLARNIYLMDDNRVQLAVVGDALGGTKNVWNLYSPSISAAGCRYVVVSLGLTSGTPFTGDYHIDNVCITYA